MYYSGFFKINFISQDEYTKTDESGLSGIWAPVKFMKWGAAYYQSNRQLLLYLVAVS